MRQGKENIDVLYLVEHPLRELDVACVVTRLLKRHGLKAKVASLSFDLWKTIQTVSPRLIVTPFFYSAKDHALYDLKHHYPGVPFLSLNFEQALSASEAAFYCPKDDYSRTQVFHVAWADFYKELLVSKGVKSDNIFFTGNPQLGLLLPPYTASIPDRETIAKKFNLDPAKRWVFFPLNYTWAFLSENQLQNRIDKGYNADKAHAYRDFLIKSVQGAIEWWRALEHIDDIELILRPKPTAPKERFLAQMNAHWPDWEKKAKVISDLRITDWVEAIDFAFTSFSTSIFQTSLANKPSWVMEPVPFPDFFTCDVNEVIPALKTKEEFVKVVETCRGWTPEQQKVQDVIKQRWLAKGDPLVTLTDLIVNLVNTKGAQPNPSLRPLGDTLEYKASQLLVKLKQKVNPPKGISNFMQHYYFDNKDISSTDSKWAEIIP